jgi:hypothetical protein
LFWRCPNCGRYTCRQDRLFGFRLLRNGLGCPNCAALNKYISKSLQQRTGTSPDSAFLDDPRVNKFFLRVVALLDEVLEDSCGGFLRAFTGTGNTCAADSLTKAPCDRFGINLSGKPFPNRGEARDSQSAGDSS